MNQSKRYSFGYMPGLTTPTPTPTPSPITPSFAKLSGQIVNKEQEECTKLVSKYLSVPIKYWDPPKYIFDYKKTLRNNILTYQTWRPLNNSF